MKEKFRALMNLKHQSMRIQQRLLLYWISMVLAIFATLLILLSVSGVFSGSDKDLQLALDTQQDNTVVALNTQFSRLTAQGVSISENVSDMLADVLMDEPVAALNDNPELLLKLEQQIFDELIIALRSNPCNGAFLLLDATTNTSAPGAEHSGAGVYLRFANLNDKNAVDQDITFYRGIPEIARENQLELHNRWKLEFDTDKVVGYEKAMMTTDTRLADSVFWTGRTPLTDTWEYTNIMMIPVRSKDDSVRGICGLELSDLYFRLSYPSHATSFGSMATVVAPVIENRLYLSKGMAGGLEGTYLYDTDYLTIEEGKYFNTYSDGSNTYLGVQTQMDLNMLGGDEVYVVTLVPEESYLWADSFGRTVWLLGALCFLAVTLLASVYLSRRFAQPISAVITALQTEETVNENTSGITEIDALLRYIRSKSQQSGEGTLPPDIAELFNTFADHASALTPTERSIVKYYADGKDINEVAELAFISIHTVRRHNANIYQKLGVGSRDELMLYIELFRRSNRLNELF